MVATLSDRASYPAQIKTNWFSSRSIIVHISLSNVEDRFSFIQLQKCISSKCLEAF